MKPALVYFDQMPMNEDHKASVLSDTPSWVPLTADLAVNDKGNMSSARIVDPPPPLEPKPTNYRPLVVTSTVLWAVAKAVVFYRNRSIEATMLDLIAALFGLGLLFASHKARRREGREGEVAPTFGMYFLSRAEWALSSLCDMLVFHPFISLFFIGACLLLARYLPNWGTTVVSIGLTVPVLIIFMSLLVRATSGRTQCHTRQAPN